MLFIAAFTLAMLGFSQTTTPTYEEAVEVFEKMNKSVKAIKTMECKFLKNERYQGKIIKSEQEFKLSVVPKKKVYMKIIKGPNAGTEVLFIPSENGGKAIVSAGKFIPNIDLSPFSSLMRDKQRNTIYELGFSYTGDVIYKNFNKYKETGEKLYNEGWAKYEGIIDFDGRKCYKVSIDNKGYKILDYTVLKGETFRSIAHKLILDEYNLVELNPSVKDGYKLTPGQVIKVPSDFCKYVTVYVDVKTNLPVYQKIADEKGVMGEYTYLNLKINETIADEEFTKDYDGYGF